jgi:hypothetical protein
MMEFLIGFVAGIAAFWIYSLYRALSLLTEMANVRNIPAKKTRKVKIEEHGDNRYAYCAKTDAFLCRFNDIQDLNGQLEKIDPNVVWICDQEDIMKLMNHVKSV